MKRSHLLLSLMMLLGFSMFTVQCTSPLVLCSRFYSVIEAKRGECSVVVSGSQSTCEENISQCSDSDRQLISETLDCMDKLEVCAKGEGIQFGLALASCSAKLKNISLDCAKAFAL